MISDARIHWSSDLHIEWGVKGHHIINHQASKRLLDPVPLFFRDSSDRIAALASMPDRWKIPELTALEDANRPDHGCSVERMAGHDYPPTRSKYFEAVI